MPVRIGDIELRGVQKVRADDNRTLVELRVPGQSGAVFQDLGRAPASLTLEGVLSGTDAEPSLESLRAAYQTAEPRTFASDIAIGTELTEVVIADLFVRQEAGFRDRYRFQLRLREHVEPPPSQSAQDAAVQREAAAEGAGWAEDAGAAAAALDDPGGLAGALGENPGLLDHLSAEELGDAVGGALDQLDGDQLGDLLNKVGELDPSKAGGLLERLKGMGKLGGFLAALIEKGRTLLPMLKKLGGILANAGEILDLVKAVKALIEAGKKLEGGVTSLISAWGKPDAVKGPADWPLSEDPADAPPALPEPTPRTVVGQLAELIDRLAAVVAQPILKKLIDLAREYGLATVVDTVARGLVTALGWVQSALGGVRRFVGWIEGVAAVAEIGDELAVFTVDMVALMDEEQARSVQSGADEARRTLQWAVALARSLPGTAEVDRLNDGFGALRAAFAYWALAQGALPSTVPAPGALR